MMEPSQVPKGNSFRQSCPTCKKALTMVCVNADCYDSAFVCEGSHECMSTHRHEPTPLVNWDKYAMSLRRAMEVEAFFEETAEQVSKEWEYEFSEDQEKEASFGRMVGQARRRTIENEVGIHAILKCIREGRLNDITGRQMGRLVTALERETYKNTRSNIARQFEIIRERLQEQSLYSKPAQEQYVSVKVKGNRNPWVWVSLFLLIALISCSIEARNKQKSHEKELLQWRNKGCLVQNTSTGRTQVIETLRCGNTPNSASLTCYIQSSERERFEIAAKLLIREEQYSKAIKEINQAEAELGNVASLSYLRGKAYMKLNKFEQSLPSLRKAVQMDPTNISYRKELAFALRKLRLYPEAIEQLNQAIRSNNTDGKLYRDIGIIYFKKGDFDKAVELLRISLKHQDKPELTHFYLSMCYHSLNRHSEALNWINEAIAVNPGNPDYHLRKSWILKDMGLKDEAEKSKSIYDTLSQ